MNEPDGLRCPRCGHALTGLTHPRCPECGEPFIITDLEGYAARRPVPLRVKLCWVVWIAGFGLVILSWFGLVSSGIGWAGFVAGSAGALVSYNVPTLTAGSPGL